MVSVGGAGTQIGLIADAQALGDYIGRLEANAVDVAGQAVWILPHHLDGVVAVSLEDAKRPAGADFVSRGAQNRPVRGA